VLRKSGHEHFRGSLVVPIFDTEGTVANIYGRKLRDDLRKGTPLHVWLNDNDNGALNPTGFIEGQKLILTGSVMAALTWWSNGFHNVSTITGREKLPKAVRALLTDKNIRSVALALPRDENTDIIATDLRDLGIEVILSTLFQGVGRRCSHARPGSGFPRPDRPCRSPLCSMALAGIGVAIV
jgi:hypothetical protein